MSTYIFEKIYLLITVLRYAASLRRRKQICYYQHPCKSLSLSKKKHIMKTQTKTSPKLYIGIDFHKKTWRVHFRSEFSGNPFSMEPNPKLLQQKVLKEFSRYSVEVVYECGCFGYWAHRDFEIVKVARKLLSRIYGVLRTETPYEIGLIQ